MHLFLAYLPIQRLRRSNTRNHNVKEFEFISAVSTQVGVAAVRGHQAEMSEFINNIMEL